jgi:hypothetical protein
MGKFPQIWQHWLKLTLFSFHLAFVWYFRSSELICYSVYIEVGKPQKYQNRYSNRDYKRNYHACEIEIIRRLYFLPNQTPKKYGV